jgi:ABC-type Fe3+/spermidine/putrescine transport system ATPase subunit
MTITEPFSLPVPASTESREALEHGHRVSVRGARKQYGALAALDGLDLDIEPGRFTVLLGPSGSGKSTLVRSIAGIERLDEGSIHLGDVAVSDGHRYVAPERRGLSMVFQDYALWPHLTAQQNVAYALKRRRLPVAEATKLVGEALERVGLSAKGGHYPSELSGGEQQRVALARAVVGQPSLLLFDEPLSNLDADLRERLRVEISTLTRESGATALYITHDQSEAFALADEVGVLRAGRLEQFAAPEEIYQNPATPFVAQFTGLAGSFSGRVVHARNGRVAVDLGRDVVFARGSESLGVIDDAIVLIRPTATSLEAATDHPEAASASTVPINADSAFTSVLIPAVVLDVAYRGRGYEHVVECRYGVLGGVFDTRPWSRGMHCSVRIDPSGCIAFPADTGTN